MVTWLKLGCELLGILDGGHSCGGASGFFQTSGILQVWSYFLMKSKGQDLNLSGE